MSCLSGIMSYPRCMDTVVAVDSFAGKGGPAAAEFSDFDGFFHVKVLIVLIADRVVAQRNSFANWGHTR